MWTRSLLKQNAKQALQGKFWVSFAVCLVAALLGAGGVSSGSGVQFQQSSSAISSAATPDVWTGNAAGADSYSFFLGDVPGFVWVMLLFAVLVGLAVGLCVQAFLCNPVHVGRCRYFMENRLGRAPFGTLFSTFRKPYLNMVKVELLTNLKVAAGYFLFIVPGIYWNYCYALVPYLLAENPYLSTGRAMELSQEMMQGEKLRFWVLQLSFIGWELLSMLTFGIGLLFLEPYIQATKAEFYAAMRSKAFALGMTDAGELGGFVRHNDVL